MGKMGGKKFAPKGDANGMAKAPGGKAMGKSKKA